MSVPEVEHMGRMELMREVLRLREALIQMDEAVCHGAPETAKRIAREAYGHE